MSRVPELLAHRSPLLNKQEAAEFCGVCRRTFERKVQPHLPAVSIGSRVLFDEEDLRKWLDAQKAGSSGTTIGRGFSTSGSRTLASATASLRANEILAQLRARQRGSTPRLFPVGGRRSEP